MIKCSVLIPRSQAKKGAEMSHFSRKEVWPLFYPVFTVLKIGILLDLQYFVSGKKCCQLDGVLQCHCCNCFSYSNSNAFKAQSIELKQTEQILEAFSELY